MDSFATFAVKNKVGGMISNFKQQQQTQYNWDNYNYPPKINLFHLDITELPEGNRFVRCMVSIIFTTFRVGMRFIMFGLFSLLIMGVANLAFSIILTFFAARENWKWILLSLVNIPLLIVIFLFYAQRSFKAIALREGGCCYLGIGGGICLLCLFFALFPLAFFHGIISMAFRKPGTFFYIFSPIESVCWLVTMGLLAFGIFRGKKV
jgi:uncharacterized membrane-anchored protein YitT (DUF2179 family)